MNRFATRLVDIKENSKFKSSGSDGSCINLHDFIDDIKDKFGLKSVSKSGCGNSFLFNFLKLSLTLTMGT